jgi:SAM-dependent methyltransferase
MTSGFSTPDGPRTHVENLGPPARWDDRRMAVDAHSPEYAAQVAARWAKVNGSVRSWWQSPVVLAEINRRITGDPEVAPEEYFVDRYCREPVDLAVSLGAGGGQLERRLFALGACRRLIGVDIAETRVARANSKVKPELRDRIRFECANLERWRPPEPVDLVVARDVLHHIEGLESLCRSLTAMMRPGALLYCDEYVGPTRFQWSDEQLRIIGRLLERLSPELVTDLVSADGTLRREARRPDLDRFIAEDPSEAIRSDEIPGVLAAHFELVEHRDYGGAVFNQLFNRIMGNFAGHDDLVRTIMEIDFILCDAGVLRTDHRWAVYRLSPC